MTRRPRTKASVDDVVFAFDPSLRGAAIQVAARLRASGRAVDLVLEQKKVKWAFKHADRRGASRVVLIAPDEWARGLVRVKDLRSGDQQEIALDQLQEQP